MPSPRRVSATARASGGRVTARVVRARYRAIARVTREVAIVIANVRKFFDGECAAGRATGVGRPVERTARATGVGQRTVERVTADGRVESLPSGREAPTRSSRRRVPPDEQARMRAAVYAQYENRTIPTLDTTLA